MTILKCKRRVWLLISLAFATISNLPSAAKSSSGVSADHSEFKLVVGRIGGDQSQSKTSMTLAAAQLYILSLVNADRAKFRLAPLSLDGIASRAGQMHTDEMAEVGYISHEDTAGRSPAQRYTECGGEDNVSENVAFVEMPQKDFANPATQLQRLYRIFMSEKPPNDGHRQNILSRLHNKLGIGISYSVNEKGMARLCLAQEFVDDYGQFSNLPAKVAHKVPFEIAGSFAPGVNLNSVFIDWEPAPKQLTKAELEYRGAGLEAEEGMAVFMVSPGDDPDDLKLWKKGQRQHFSARVIPGDHWKPGLYVVSIGANIPGIKTPITVSSRTTLMFDK